MVGGRGAKNTERKHSGICRAHCHGFGGGFHCGFMNSLILALVQLVFILSLAPFAAGLVIFFKALLQGRRGVWPWVPYVVLAKLLRKENIVPPASWMFRVAPFVVLATAFFLALVLPLTGFGHFSAELSNFIVVTSVLALSSAFLVMGALDAGSGLGGVGASRTMTVLALLGPTTILTFAALALITDTSNISAMVGTLATATPVFPLIALPTLLLPILTLGLLALAENGRYPLANSSSVIELITEQRSMLLQYSGPYLAMLEYGAAIKLTVFAVLIANFILPVPLLTSDLSLVAVLLGIVGVFFASVSKIVVTMFGLAILESTIAKMRFYRFQEYLTAIFFMALASLVLALVVDLL